MQTETVNLGFIYDAKKQQHVIKRMVDHFRQFSKEYKIRLVLFTLENLDIKEQIINGTTITSNDIRQEHAALPPLIYNFAMHYTVNQIGIMRNLRKMDNVTVINPINRFIQDIIFEMLTTLTGSQQFLLPSATFNESTLTEYLNNKYHTLFLLPKKTFHPPKAVVIKRFRKNHYMICFGQNGKMCSKDDLLDYIKKMINNKKYILMKGIKYFHWGKGPLEARVYLQKGAGGEWSNITISAKSCIFSRDNFYGTKINNILNGFITNEIKDIEQKLADISLRICRFFDFYIPFLGSCTIDYIFDEDHCPYLVYVGGFEQNQYLYLSMDPTVQYKLLNKAFHYLLFLANYSNEKG